MKGLLGWMMMLVMLALAPTARAQEPTHISAQLVAEGRGQPGATLTLALDMHPAHGWHGYWLNPGDAGLGMQLTWRLPPASTGTPQYPVPETLVVGGLMNHVYQSDYAVLVPFTVPANAAPGTTLPIAVKAEWLACTEQVCVPESADLSLNLPISAFPAARDALRCMARAASGAFGRAGASGGGRR
jgi:DsbC/DsbD-like thiol-disulfide interchange protein